jgi:GntR family transcriptional regulator, transcriptional repressor for pyruvate dehydrogenase complex
MTIGVTVVSHESAWKKPIINRHLADDIVDRLVTALALGLYVPAQQLPPERELAVMFGVSRVCVRDALKLLTDNGYLEVRRGRSGGYFVRTDWGPQSAEHVRRQLIAHWGEFENIFDARKLIEPLIARTASERWTMADMLAIEEALQAYLDAPDRDASRRADFALHLAIVRATHNPILVSISVDLRTKISLNSGAEPYTEAVRRVAMLQHQELVAAIRDRQADRAAAIAQTHFALSETLIRQLVSRTTGETAGKPGEQKGGSV